MPSDLRVVPVEEVKALVRIMVSAIELEEMTEDANCGEEARRQRRLAFANLGAGIGVLEAVAVWEGWTRVGCTVCGRCDSWPTDRVEREGMPICPHQPSAMLLPATYTSRDPRWTPMVEVAMIVVPTEEEGADGQERTA